MNSLWLDLGLYLVALVAFATSYLAFSPVTRDLVAFLSRNAQIRIFRHRHALWAVGGVAAAALLVRVLMGEVPLALTIIAALTAAAFALAFWATYVPVVMAPPKEQRVVIAEEADRLLDPDETVLGLIVDDRARAYPRRLIARPHWFNDEFNGKPLMVSYCILCNSAQAFVPIVNGKRLDLRNMTAYNNNTVYHDLTTGNYIQQLEGKVIAGPDEGAELEQHPVVLTKWKDWKALHPDTDLLYAPPLTLRDRATQWMLDTMIPLERLARRSRPWHLLRGRLDTRLPAMSFVFGVAAGGEARAYPLTQVRREQVINDVVGDEPLVLLYRADRDAGQIFRRRINGRELTLEAVTVDPDTGAVARDRQTDSYWNVAGRALWGELAGAALETVPHYNKLFWFSWAAFYPQTEIYEGTEETTPGHGGAEPDEADSRSAVGK